MALLDPLFGATAMDEIFSDDASLERMLDFERALARAQAASGLIPPAAAESLNERIHRSVKVELNAAQLPRNTRSLVTLAIMAALNRAEEFRLHVGAAFNHGVTRDQIKQVLLHTAIYCGVPAANSAFHAAAEVSREMDEDAKAKPKKRKRK
jgi:alkylhydroperoxidase/carboxymuconolactone decarboxylase family protein YurZ